MENELLYQYSGKSSPWLGKGFSFLSRKMWESPKKYLRFYSNGKNTLELSFKEYFSKVAGLNNKIRHQIKPGDHVIVALGNTPEAFVAYGSLLSLGGVLVPIDPKEGSRFFEEVIRLTEPALILSSVERDPKVPHFHFAFTDLEEKQFQDFTDHEPVSLFFTSGTTGGSKGVSQKFSSYLANLEATVIAGKLSKDDVLFSCMHVFHVNAFNFAFLLPLMLECPVVFCSEYPLNFWKVLSETGVTIGSMSPPVIRLINSDKRTQTVPDTLRYFISASSALYLEDIDTMKSRFNVRILQAYGLSETINFTLFTPSDLNEKTYEEVTALGPVPSAGVPTSGNDVQLLSSDGSLINEENREGEVIVRGWSVLREYFGNKDATHEAFQGNYFHTGDVAFFRVLEGKKFFFLTGRSKEVVKRKGKLIYLSEIDGVIKSLGLSEACAVGFPNTHTEEEIGLFLVKGSTDLDHDIILKQLKSKLHPAKTPKVIVIGDEIPKTSVGKIKRQILKSQFGQFRETKFYE